MNCNFCTCLTIVGFYYCLIVTGQQFKLPLSLSSVEKFYDLSNSSLYQLKSILNHFDVIFIAFTFTFDSYRQMKYDLIKVSDNLSQFKPIIPIARFDCSTESGLKVCYEFNIISNPTLALIR